MIRTLFSPLELIQKYPNLAQLASDDWYTGRIVGSTFMLTQYWGALQVKKVACRISIPLHMKDKYTSDNYVSPCTDLDYQMIGILLANN
jgi:hypothetical protein